MRGKRARREMAMGAGRPQVLKVITSTEASGGFSQGAGSVKGRADIAPAGRPEAQEVPGAARAARQEAARKKRRGDMAAP